MPRYYTKQKKSIDCAVLVDAVRDIKVNKKSILSVANACGIPHATLSRYVAKVENADLDVATASNELLMDFFGDASKRGAKAVCDFYIKYFLSYKINKLSNNQAIYISGVQHGRGKGFDGVRA